MTVAALYVARGGVYYDPALTDVEPWGLPDRDAREYRGPCPVVAHPPCARWCSLAGFVQHVYGYQVGDDGGCFQSALSSVRRFGGVLEHPAFSIAWRFFDLPTPTRGQWVRSLFDNGWVTEVSQVAYGHRARKRTWLYCVGATPPPLDWSEPEATMVVGHCTQTAGGVPQRCNHKRMSRREGSSTPPAFRDMLLELARSCRVTP